MNANSAQIVPVPEPKPVEATTPPAPVQEPSNKPFRIKVRSQIPC